MGTFYLFYKKSMGIKISYLSVIVLLYSFIYNKDQPSRKFLHSDNSYDYKKFFDRNCYYDRDGLKEQYLDAETKENSKNHIRNIDAYMHGRLETGNNQNELVFYGYQDSHEGEFA